MEEFSLAWQLLKLTGGEVWVEKNDPGHKNPFCHLDLSILYFIAVTGVMYEEDDAYSILDTWSCYWENQFFTPANKT